MRRFLKQMGFVFIGIFLLLCVLDLVLTWILSETPLYGIGSNEKVDYLILGDSRSAPLKADYLSSITGKKVMNISSHGLTYDETLKIVDYFFKNGNSADTVFLQVDPKFCAYTKPAVEFEYYAHLLRQNGLFRPRFPFKFYLSNRANIKLSKAFIMAYKMRMSGKNEPEKDQEAAKITKFRVNKAYLEDNSKNTFRIDDIVNFEKQLLDKGVKEVIAFSAPHLPAWIATQSDSATFKVKIREQGLKYVDLSYAYSDTSYFRDHLHLNRQKHIEFNRDFIRRMTTSRIK